VKLEALARSFTDSDLPALDRREPDLLPDEVQSHWREHGYVIVRDYLPDSLMDAYSAAWLRSHGPPDAESHPRDPTSYKRPGGWPHATPYMDCPELRALVTYKPLTDLLAHLIGEPMGVHLNLTGWRSTLRDWHQDGYLNPDHVADHYAAVWIALDQIDPDSGPFEYVAGTHRWPAIRQDLMLRALGEDGQSPTWPERSERFLTPIFEKRFRTEGRRRRFFEAGKGDVLVWHARLAHRGSPPKNPDLERRAVIAHYSGVRHRPDMPTPESEGAGLFFPIQNHTPIRSSP
jgi:hypothetical protein